VVGRDVRRRRPRRNKNHPDPERPAFAAYLCGGRLEGSEGVVSLSKGEQGGVCQIRGQMRCADDCKVPLRQTTKQRRDSESLSRNVPDGPSRARWWVLCCWFFLFCFWCLSSFFFPFVFLVLLLSYYPPLEPNLTNLASRPHKHHDAIRIHIKRADCSHT
jgi:hypothetical protein